MTLIVTFAGKTPLPSPDAGPWYQVWSYTVRPGTPADLHRGQRIALAIPADVDVRDPGLFPDVPALAGTFVESDSGVSRRYVGRTVTDTDTDTGSGSQTISFIAPPSQEDRELFLVTRAVNGATWSVTPFAKTSGGPAAHFQTLPAPGRPADGSHGRPVYDFAGAFPYADEPFGARQAALPGWPAHSTASRLGPSRVNGVSRGLFTGAVARRPAAEKPERPAKPAGFPVRHW